VPLSLALLLILLVAATWMAGSQPTPATPSFEPGSIAYVRAGALYITGPDGSSEVLLDDGGENDSIRFAFAPDRVHIASMRIGTSGSSLSIIAADGTVVGASSWDGDPDWLGGSSAWSTWAPDGQRLAVPSTSDPGEIRILGLDGQRLDSVALPKNFVMGWPWTPSWSPDGRTIAMLGCDEPCDEKFDTHVLLVAPDGSGWRWLNDEAAWRGVDAGTEGYVVHLAWAPDSRLAVGHGSDIRIAALDGSQALDVRLPDGMLVDDMAWSPDGGRLAVEGGWPVMHDPPSSMVVVDDTGLVTVVPPTPDRPDWFDIVAWSPDGREVILAGPARASGRETVWAVDLEAGDSHPIMEGGFDGEIAIATGSAGG
jgi:WD40 repeat protein